MEAMRSLILDDLEWEKVVPGFGVVVLSIRMIRSYDRRPRDLAKTGL